MPELPEVETMRRHIERSWPAGCFETLRSGWNGSCSGLRDWDPANSREPLSDRLAGGPSGCCSNSTTGSASRCTSAWPASSSTTGRRARLCWGIPVPALDVPRPHKSTHAIFHFDDDSTLYYTDIRQFGRIHVVPSGEVPEFLARRKLGVEPLTDDFQPTILETVAGRRPRTKLKALLLDQRVVAGIGNIYADESLHRSGLHPAQQLAEVSGESFGRLRQAIKEVLRDAVENGVAEVVNGKAKPDARLPRVHGRQGEPCPRCGTAILKAQQDGRGTYWCPECQSRD